MAHLAISLLGSFQVKLDGRAVTEFESNKVRALLAYLAAEADQPHSRDELVGLLWPDQPDAQARNNLRHVLTVLRQAIGDARTSPPFLTITRDSIQFNTESDYWVDIAAFGRFLAACKEHSHRRAETCRSCAERFAQAAELYRGDFLEHLFADSPAFEEWVLVKREKLRQRALEVLYRLAEYHERRGEYEQAHGYAARQLELDPWHEEAHRQVMRALALGGQRSAALEQYEACRRALRDELSVEPAEETIALYERIASGALPAPAPVSPGHLPVYPTSFVGRRTDLDEIGQMLENPTCRLLTLVGPGGIGKTRLALQAAAEHVGMFEHGAHFVPLAPLNSVESLVPAIAGALQFPFTGQQEPKTQLLNYLRGKDMLLILDNMEHLLEGTGLIAEILQAAPRVSVLATTRERLDLQWEWLFDVEGLDYPPSDGVVEVEAYGAVQLFRERACQVGRQPGRDERSCVARICRLVEGMPLAVELAAASMRTQSCGQVAGALEANLRSLALTLRDVPARHRSMWAAFEHSWGLLDEAERRVFRRLSVFRSGFDAEAAGQVAGADPALLDGLVIKSMARRDSTGRYDVHELLRQYGSDKLAESGEAERVLGQHSMYYLALAERAAPALHGPGQVAWLNRLETEHDNLRAALNWTLASPETEFQVAGARLAVAASGLWYSRAFLNEGLGWLARVLRQRERLPASIQGQALSSSGWLALLQGNYMQAKEFFESSLELGRQTGDQKVIAEALSGCGNVARHLHNTAQAEALFEESLAAYQVIDDPRGMAMTIGGSGMAMAMGGLANMAVRRGNYQKAILLRQKCIEIYQQAGDELSLAIERHSLSYMVAEDGNLEQAEAIMEESLEAYRRLGARWRIAQALGDIGIVAMERGDRKRARRLFEECLASYRKLGSDRGIAGACGNLGELLLHDGELDRAAALLRESLRLAQSGGKRADILAALAGLAGVIGSRARSGSGDKDGLLRAVRLLSAVESLNQAIGVFIMQVERAESDRNLAAVRAHLDPASFEKAWAQGQTVTLEEAIACVLEGDAS